MTKSYIKKAITTAMAFTIAATAFTSHSFASTTSTVEAGDLTGGTITFAPLATKLDGTKKTPAANWQIADIIDARGSGEGWNVTLKLEPFKEFNTDSNAYVTDGKSLATSSLKVKTAPTIGLNDDTSSPKTTITPVSLETALDTGSNVKILSAALDGGMGSYTFGDLGVELTIPANAYARTYKTEATVTLNEAP